MTNLTFKFAGSQSGDVGSATVEYDLATAISDAVASKTFLYIITFWMVLEIAFAAIIYWGILPKLHKLRPAPPYHGNIVNMMKKTFDEVKILESYSFEMYVSGFCNGAKFEDIHIDNFRSFLAWGMFHKHLETVTAQEEEDIAEVLDHIGKIHPEVYKLKPGKNPAVTNCAMTLEPLPIIHRPLLIYLLVNLSETFANAVFLRAGGFQSMEHEGTHYWYKEGGHGDAQTKQCSDGTEPMVFLHGISTGWMLYTHLVKEIGSHRTLILVDLDAIKIKSLNFDMPTPRQFAKSVSEILHRHHIGQASFVGHSFGSVTAGWFVRYFPEMVTHLTLIDPVTLLLSFPEVAYSFLYREPTSLTEWVIYLMAARELTISHALRRHFWWYNNALWLEEVPDHIGVVVGVSSRDEIIHPQAVFEYTQNCRQKRLAARRQQRIGGGNSMSCSSGYNVYGNTSNSTVNTTTPRRVTRSMVHSSSSDSSVTTNKFYLDSGDSTPTKISTPTITKAPIGMIECVMWEGFSHGQILLPTQAQKHFIKMVKCNEKIGSGY